MKGSSLISIAAAVAAASGTALAASAEPPMGQFNGAFYACDQGQAFQLSYDAPAAKIATLTTSNNNHRYNLKRVSSSAGPQFSDGTVSVSISGEGATVQGTQLKLTGCKLKNTV